eukprot:sb/3478294/
MIVIHTPQFGYHSYQSYPKVGYHLANQLPPLRAISVVCIEGALWATYRVFSKTANQLLTWLSSSHRYKKPSRDTQHHIWSSRDDTTLFPGKLRVIQSYSPDN